MHFHRQNGAVNCFHSHDFRKPALVRLGETHTSKCRQSRETAFSVGECINWWFVYLCDSGSCVYHSNFFLPWVGIPSVFVHLFLCLCMWTGDRAPALFCSCDGWDCHPLTLLVNIGQPSLALCLFLYLHELVIDLQLSHVAARPLPAHPAGLGQTAVSESVSLSLSGSVCIWVCLYQCFCLGLSVSVSGSVSLSGPVSVSLSGSVCSCVSVWVCISVSIWVCLFLCLHLGLSVPVSLSGSVCIWVCLYQCFCLGLPVSVSLSGSVCVSVSVRVCLYQCLCPGLSVSGSLSGSVCFWVSVWVCVYLCLCL